MSGDDLNAGRAGQQVITGANVGRLVRSLGFDISLLVLGATSAITTVAARLEDPVAWGTADFLAVLGFGALLITLGCADRMFGRPIAAAGQPLIEPVAEQQAVDPPS